MSARFVIAPRVAEALAAGRAVVALETTVVTHGFPAPAGVRVALEMEAEIERLGAVAASIGVIDGAVRIGLPRAELERLAAMPEIEKLNPGNLAAAVAAGRAGSTTVAATAFAAARSGIEVFATGGIGGVHRGAAESGDVSADLIALARWPVAVVCAGAKAVLDLPRTVEMLETLGVPVFGYRTNRFPAFYRRDSGLAVDARIDEIAALARAVGTHFMLGSGTGVVIGNPVPAEHEMTAELYDTALAGALDDARSSRVLGREVTPFLLERMRERTDGESVRVNRELLLHNARVAAELAVALARIRNAS